MDILEVKNLTKKYGDYQAVDGISFRVKRGQVIGFLGPNGAGKSTTIQMLCGITLPTSGEISYFGMDFFKQREKCLQRINYTSAFSALIGRISVWENLYVYGLLYSIPHPKKKIAELAEYLEAEDLLRQNFWDLSAGQKTRVNIMKSLLNDPELILMDEPTASLDPDIADKMLNLIENLRSRKNVSILYTSHDMEEVERVCDEVIFLEKGNIVAQDTPLGLTKRISNTTLFLTFDAQEELVKKYLQDNGYTFLFHGRNRVEIKTEEKIVPKIIFGLSNENVWITDIEVKKPTLEDFFLHMAREN